MPEYELSTLKLLRRYLIENGERVKMRRLGPERTDLRRRLDERLLAFRAARSAAAAEGGKGAETQSWLRAIRQALGVPVEVMARRLEVTKYEVFRVERAEGESRIVLATLRRAADALGCELIYALVPREGSLEDLVAAEREEREKALKLARAKNEAKKRKTEEWIDWRAAIREMLRREMRKVGIRVR